jgi:hypothetical protein
MLTASEKLAVELVVLPFPFAGRERAAIEAEYAGLLAENVKPGEIADVVLFALEILINKKNQTKDMQLTLKPITTRKHQSQRLASGIICVAQRQTFIWSPSRGRTLTT